MVQICETVTGTDMAALIAARDAVRAADMVELRLDGVQAPDVQGALAGRTRPVLVTCRTRRDGGVFDGAEEDRARLLRRAVEWGAELVDVEFDASDLARRAVPAERQVLSLHCVAGPPDDLVARAVAMAASRPAVVKIAFMARRLADLEIARRLADALRDQRHVVIAMGEPGLLTRLHPSRFGSAWTYAGSAAPGQLPADVLATCYRVRETTPSTELYGVAGMPIAHSASPAMHNAAFAATGRDAVYVPFACGDAADLFDSAEQLGVRGLSVTAPLKSACFAALEHVDDVSRRAGAVNTLRWREGRREGANFDVEGFLAPLDARAEPLGGRTAVVLGAGGAAGAAAIALSARGAIVEICARRAEAAAALAGQLGVTTREWPPAAGWDLLVNATPSGTAPDTGGAPIESGRLAGGLVYDLVYNPPETELMRRAAARGIDAIGGLAMLVAQAVRQFEWWTGERVESSVMREAAATFLQRAG